jgi:hypothetical protein
MAAATNSAAPASCCSTFYEQDWVRELAEHGFHPGGAALTRRTVDGMRLPPGAALLDLGCGVADSSRLVAAERGFAVTGVDLSRANLARRPALPAAALEAASEGESEAAAPGESAAASAAGAVTSAAGAVALVQGDAVRLPLRAGSFDGVLCECTLSLFRERRAALGEIRRVLVADGVLGLTDMCVTGELAPEFASSAADWACLAGAASAAEYASALRQAGFGIDGIVDESHTLIELVGQLKRKLLVVGAGGLAQGRMPFDLKTVLHWLRRFEAEVERGAVAYIRIHASRAGSAEDDAKGFASGYALRG